MHAMAIVESLSNCSVLIGLLSIDVVLPKVESLSSKDITGHNGTCEVSNIRFAVQMMNMESKGSVRSYILYYFGPAVNGMR